MNYQIKSSVIIRMGTNKVSIPFYVLDDGQYYANENVQQFFSKNVDENMSPVILLSFENNVEIKTKAYSLDQVVENITNNTLKQLALSGLKALIESGGDKVEDKEERKLSDFDKLMLQAMKHKPKG